MSLERFARREEQAVLLGWGGKGNSADQGESTYWIWAHKRWHKTLVCHTCMLSKSFTSLDFRDLRGTAALLQHSYWIALLFQGHVTRNRPGEIWWRRCVMEGCKTNLKYLFDSLMVIKYLFKIQKTNLLECRSFEFFLQSKRTAYNKIYILWAVH